MVKVTFEHVYKTMPAERTTKLTAFQEFVCTLIKLSINPLIQDLGCQFDINSIKNTFKMVKADVQLLERLD